MSKRDARKAITEAIAACWETDCPDEVITLLLRAKVRLLQPEPQPTTKALVKQRGMR